MDISFTPNGWEDLEYWITNDPDTVTRIKDLIKSIRQDPFRGFGCDKQKFDSFSSIQRI